MNQETLNFIRQHAQDDVQLLALRHQRESEVDLTYALEQIAGRQKARQKLPSWAAVEGLVYPPHLALEQCSSEQTARYKAGIAAGGDLFVDLTAGFGVDMAFISKGFQRAIHVERQERLCAISSNNYKLLGLGNIEVVCADGVSFLENLPSADLIFIDPARRDARGGRTYGIADCSPNVLDIADQMLMKARRILVKLSPMLDWHKAVADLACHGRVECVHIVSIDNECKELLIEMRAADTTHTMSLPKVVCVNLLSNGCEEKFEFRATETAPSFTVPLPAPRFLYEPNASIMKAGCFGLLTQRYQVAQVGPNSHLFVSDAEVQGFPGRHFSIERVTSLNRRDLKQALSGISHANIAVRNFPLTVAELRKRLKLRDGGDVFIFATTVGNHDRQLFVCRKKS